MCQSLFFKEETLAQVFSCEFCEISKNTFFHRTPLVAASECPNDTKAPLYQDHIKTKEFGHVRIQSYLYQPQLTM